jgi:hypothetical protein
MVEDDCFYWAKRYSGDKWQPALSVVFPDEVLFYFPMMDWAAQAFEVGPKIERHSGNDDD